MSLLVVPTAERCCGQCCDHRACHRFRWLSGETSIRAWRSPEGFRADFCRECGAPLPNPLRDLPYVWVPAGLLDAEAEGEIVAHLCVDSRALWDRAILQGQCHGEVPELLALLYQLGIAEVGAADRS
jgi:hypothetical protein